MKRIVVFVLALIVITAGLGLLIPGSPFYIDKFFGGDGRMYDGKSVRYWRKELANPDKDARLSALQALGAVGPDADDAVPEVGRLLTEDPDPEVREFASLALAKMAPHSKAVLPQLIASLTDKHFNVRLNSIHAIGRLKADGRPAVPALIATMQDPANDTNMGLFHHTIQEGAASVLGDVSAGTAEAVAPLTAVLNESDNDKRALMVAAAARALGRIGEPAKGVIPKLHVLLKHKNRFIREESTHALKALGENVPDFELTEKDKEEANQGGQGQGRGQGGGAGGGGGGGPKGKGKGPGGAGPGGPPKEKEPKA
jgi:HEAT repeat protein